MRSRQWNPLIFIFANKFKSPTHLGFKPQDQLLLFNSSIRGQSLRVLIIVDHPGDRLSMLGTIESCFLQYVVPGTRCSKGFELSGSTTKRMSYASQGGVEGGDVGRGRGSFFLPALFVIRHFTSFSRTFHQIER